MKNIGHVKDDGSHLPEWLRNTQGLGDSVVTEEMQRRIDELMRSSTETIEATYKIEVVLGERSNMNPIAGMIVVFSNGGFASGGGDEGVYFCTEPVERDGNTMTCSTPLMPDHVGGKFAVCRGCRRTVPVENLQGQMLARLTLQHWATAVEAYFRKLEGDADIRMVLLAPKAESLIKNTHLEMDRNCHGEKLQRTYDAEQTAIYPLRNIVKDLSAGATLYNRIRAFLAS